MTEIERLNIHIRLLTSRLDALEEMVRKDKPAPQRDTSWHPYDVQVDSVIGDYPNGDECVVVMRRDGIIQSPWKGKELYWGANGTDTIQIIAWRYAKEGE